MGSIRSKGAKLAVPGLVDLSEFATEADSVARIVIEAVQELLLKLALQMARDVYTRRMEGVSIWVVPSALITASEPQDKAEFFEPAADKIYRHPSFYAIPDEVGHM